MRVPCMQEKVTLGKGRHLLTGYGRIPRQRQPFVEYCQEAFHGVSSSQGMLMRGETTSTIEMKIRK
ncbi:hypothetical protein BDV26DRAFT_273569 [Aspergillus bertholletiae]|uniref:Uncharacterized protein n=1 Tax=Aspergillus bertholletiae TaxID=1226010 RepID=A0A5N7AUL1_9EURO|nr:hypothetical protein BDV26DRAFT_273569 [Aspergillus bertholletiae]